MVSIPNSKFTGSPVENLGDDIKINFDGYGDSAMTIRFASFVQAGRNFRGTKSEVNFEILRRFSAEGLEFAFPIQTLYNINSGS